MSRASPECGYEKAAAWLLDHFAFGWSTAAMFLHFVGTFVIAALHFLTGMGSFTHDVSGEVAVWKAVQWAWTPLAMAAWDPQKSLDAGVLIALAGVWSIFVGFIVGFLVPVFRKWLRKPLYPITDA